MEGSRKLVIIILILAVLIVGGTVLRNYINRIPDNPEGHLGNTAGNLLNGGRMCESDGLIYFANPYDHNALYVMNSDTSDIRKLVSNDAQYINVGGDYIYFYQAGNSDDSQNGLGYVIKQTGIFRLKNSDSVAKGLYRGNLNGMSLLGNNIYFQSLASQDYLKFCVLGTQKNGYRVISDDFIVPLSIYDGSIYYVSKEDRPYLYRFSPETEQSVLVLAEELYMPIPDGNIIYYMDIHNNYHVCSYDLSTGVKQTIVNERVDFFNYRDGVIFYQTLGSDAAIKRINADGSDAFTILTGTFTDLQLAGDYVFFREYERPASLFVAPVYGYDNGIEFTPALLAVTE